VLRPPDRTATVATVQEVVFHGHDTTVLLALNGSAGGAHEATGTVLRCRTAEPGTPGVGERVGVAVRGAARFYPAGYTSQP
jgi:hypothetical protein